MTTYDHVLTGCTPVPLAGYLKALGVLRLVAEHEQGDENARGFWLNERFVLRTRLTKDELVQFFAEKYEPSPIISPWNGRAGFLEGEDEDSDKESSREGAVLVRNYETAADRFWKLRDAVRTYSSISVIKELDKARAEVKVLQKKKKASLSEDERDRLKDLAATTKRCKTSVISSLRSEAPDWAIEWFDVCQRIAQENVVSPLLGAGGNDGSRDFGVNFGSALQLLFDLGTGASLENTTSLIQESLGFDVVQLPDHGNLGQYDPAGVGENTTTGFIGEQPFNPMNLILLLEGTVLFAGAASRRIGTNESKFSFPFTVSALTAGSGAAAVADDKSVNAAEFWAPIWTRPSGLAEIAAIFTEGRSVIGEKDVKDGLEFVVAVKTLGSQRGISEYQRFALLQREPRNPKKATPLGRVRVRENPRASLISELGAGGWLTRVRAACRDKNAPASFAQVGRNLDEALFQLAAEDSCDAVQEALIALGALMLSAAQRPKLREGLPLPPRLSEEWAAAADDSSPENDVSHEFALAEALASLDAAADNYQLPFRRHLVPLDWDKKKRWWIWGQGTGAQALAVWSGRNLVRDMASVLERRLIEAQRHSFSNQGNAELPLWGWRTAPLGSVAAFVAGNTDNGRIAALAAGLAWTKARRGAPSVVAREETLPFAYRALKPLFAPDGVGSVGEKRLLDPLPLIRIIRTGRIDDAVRRAQAMARGAGLPAPFARQKPASTADPERLNAALLFPLAQDHFRLVIERAYPDLSKDKENEIHAA